MKIVLVAAVAALAIGAYALPSQAATAGFPKAESVNRSIAQVDCVWHRHRHWVPRHVRPDGTLVPGHWVHRRVKVCD